MKYVKLVRNASIKEINDKIEEIKLCNQNLSNEIKDNESQLEVLQRMLLERKKREEENPRTKALLDESIWFLGNVPGISDAIISGMDSFLKNNFEEFFGYDPGPVRGSITIRELISLGGNEIMSIPGIWYKRRYRIADYLMNQGIDKYSIQFRYRWC